MQPVRPIDCLFASPTKTPQPTSPDPGLSLPSLPCSNQVVDLVDKMNRCGIDRVLLATCRVNDSPCERQYLCEEALSSEFLQHVLTNPERFSALVGYNAHDIQDSLRRIEEAVTKQAARGVYLSHNKLALVDRRMYPAYAKCAELSVPVGIRTNHDPDSVDCWPELEDIGTIAIEFPELRVVVACGCWPPVSRVRTLLESRDNVFFALDASLAGDRALEASDFLSTELGRNRCLWGSNGAPWQTALSAVDALNLPEQTRRRFLRDNAIAVFGLERQSTPQIEVDLILTGE